MKKKVENGQKIVLTSFRMRAASESWLKYTTTGYDNRNVGKELWDQNWFLFALNNSISHSFTLVWYAFKEQK